MYARTRSSQPVWNIKRVCNDDGICRRLIGSQADKSGIADDAVSVVVPDATVYVSLEELIDFEQEKERLTKEETRLNKEIARSNGMLNNEKFVSKAPAAKVQEEREKLEKYEQMLAQVKERLAGLQKK